MQDAFSIDGGDDTVQPAAEAAHASFAALVERHSHLVYRIALAITRSPHDAEDVAQEAFLELYRGDRWMQVADQPAYLARVAWRLAVRRRNPARQTAELDLETPTFAGNPEQSAIDAQFEALLHRAIDGLPEKFRQPLALAALGDLKLVEVAAVLGLPEGTVRRRIHDARQMLRMQFTEVKGGKR